jgi:hypothetical protein
MRTLRQLLCVLVAVFFSSAVAEAQTYPPQPDPAATRAALQKLAQAKDELKKATGALQPLRAKLQDQFKQGSEFQAAFSAYRQAQAEFEATRKPVLDALRTTKAWKDADAENRKAEEDVENLRNKGAGPDEMTPAASKAMEVGTKLTKLEGDAVAADPKSQEVRKKLVEANSKVAALWKQFEDGVKSDSAWQQALKDIDTAKQNIATAEKELAVAQAKDGEAYAQWQAKCAEIDRQNRNHYDNRYYNRNGNSGIPAMPAPLPKPKPKG